MADGVLTSYVLFDAYHSIAPHVKSQIRSRTEYSIASDNIIVLTNSRI